GRIAQTKTPHLTNQVIGDPEVRNQEWAKEMGMVAFAGYPLTIDDQVVGVLAMFARHALSDFSLEVLASVADEIALGIVRKQSEMERNRLSAAIDQISELALVTDAHGNIVYVNPAFSEITGYTAEEAIGQTPRILKGGTHPREFYTDLWEKILDGQIWSGVLINRRKDGTPYHQETTISPIRNQYGEIDSFVEIGRDVTEEANTEARLRQAEKMEAVGQLASGVAHDFNNLLQVMLAYASFVRRGIQEGNPQSADIDQIIEAGEKAAGLTRQLLSFSRETELTMAPLNVALLVKEFFKFLERTLPKTIEIQLEISRVEDIPMIVADPTGIHQALMNLCVNARDAMPDGGMLRVSIQTEEIEEKQRSINPEAAIGAYVKVSVSDTGTGIPQREMERIFEPFFTTKGEGKGTGLGLATCYGIVKQHKGFIVCESEVGKGSCFSLYFPIHDASAEEPEVEEVDSVVVGGSETILIAEDNEVVMEVLTRNLGSLGYHLICASNGEEAALLFDQNKDRIDLILTDVQMPILNGVRFAEHVLMENPGMKIILESGYMEQGLMENLHEMGVKEVLRKPVSPQFLARRIRKVLEEE
ncbi:MAG: PAS domain S-box protein, partial [Candidatus Omnitrophica bacterium]|nr:PAS domain S-box protein [Candidatus Omnitrophota bacterium]